MREPGADMDDERIETGESPPQPTGRARLGEALKKPISRGQVPAAVLLAVLGFAGAVQVQSIGQDDAYSGQRQEDLIQLLNSLAAASQRTENEIAQLEQTRSSLRNDTNSRQAALEEAQRQANVLGILAGSLPAVGTGIVVTVEDPTGAVGTDQLLNGLEELRDAGAEAIEINDTVRVIAQTSLTDGENGVIVDGVQLSTPYTIEVIGDSHTLAQALDFTGGFTDVIELPDIGGKVRVRELDNVEIATTRAPSPSEYAEPVENE